MQGNLTAEHLSAMVQKMEACTSTFTALRREQRSNCTVARTFELLSRSGRRTWQQQKRPTHQPQLESMISHIQECLSSHADQQVVVVELGAGKGMFGRLISETCNMPTVAIERCAHCIHSGCVHSAVFTRCTPTSALILLVTAPVLLLAVHSRLCSATALVLTVSSMTLSTAFTRNSLTSNATLRREVAVNYDEALGTAAEAIDEPAEAEEGEEVIEDHAEMEIAPSTEHRTFRVTADLCDCDLGAILDQAAKTLNHDLSTPAVVIAKHLCSVATDLAISCVVQQCERENSRIGTVVLAPCCHPQISWDGYSNTPWLEAQVNSTDHSMNACLSRSLNPWRAV